MVIPMLVEIAGRKPVTRGLAEQRDLVLGEARRAGYRRLDVVADGGCGKTRLLEEIAGGLHALGYVTLFSTVSPPRANRAGSSVEDRMRNDEVTYHQLIDDFARSVSGAAAGVEGNRQVLDEETGRLIADKMAAAKEKSAPIINANSTVIIEGSPDTEVTDSAIIQITVDRTPTSVLWDRWDASLGAFVEAVRELAGHCPVAILVDDLHLILGTRAGEWLLGAFSRLAGPGDRKIVILSARRPSSAWPTLESAGIDVVKLPPMSRDETEAYTQHELSQQDGWVAAEAAQIGSLIFTMTGGYPVWVTACCQMIAAEMAPGMPISQIEEQLCGGARALSEVDLPARFGKFIDDYCASLLGKSAPVFDVLTVLRRVDPELLTGMLAGQGLDQRACGRLFDWLKDDKSAFMTTSDGGGHRLHDVIRHQSEQVLRRRSMGEYRDLHASAESYYRKKLNFDQEPQEDTTYHQYGTCYEDRIWRINSREWLHHASRVGDEHFPSVRQALVRLFLDAFWWYEADFDVEHDYCRTLLADYRALPLSSSGEWLGHLEEFRENYVADTPNRRPGQDAERWKRTQDALDGLWNSMRLGDPRKIPQDHELRRIQILLSIFYGDAAYFGGTGDDRARNRAAAWYTAAQTAACLDDRDKWMANWALCINAAMWVDTKPAEARRLIEDLPRGIEDEEDNELRVHLIWLYGDLAWNAGDNLLAFDIYSRAVLHAFVFHLRQERDPQAPSRYTFQFYKMFMERTRRRLEEARDKGLYELAMTAVKRMNTLFAPYWDHAGSAPDNTESFPPQPEPDDLDKIETRFARNVRWVLNNMTAELEEPLDGPLLLS